MDVNRLSHEDALWVNRLLRTVEQLQEQTLANEDYVRQEVIVRISCTLVAIHNMLMAYRNSVRGRIDGEGGAAQLMNLTKEQIFARMVLCNLTPVDFQDPDATLRGLLQKSVVAEHIDHVLQSNGEYYVFAGLE